MYEKYHEEPVRIQSKETQKAVSAGKRKRLVLVLGLIGWKSGANLFGPVKMEVKQNRSICGLPSISSWKRICVNWTNKFRFSMRPSGKDNRWRKKWGRTKVEKVALEAQPSVALIFLPSFKPFSIFFNSLWKQTVWNTFPASMVR